MTISKLFNETELAIFFRQTGFTFTDFYLSEDGCLCATDPKSDQIFIGTDLRRANVHTLGSLSGVTPAGDGSLRFTFSDSGSREIKLSQEDSVALLEQLQDYITSEDEAPSDDAPTVEEKASLSDELPPYVETDASSLSDEDLTEVYSRLANTGKDSAVKYLVELLRMPLRDAAEYVEKLAEQQSQSEQVPEIDPWSDWTQRNKVVLGVIKKLKPGDLIHVEWKPLFGRLRSFDLQFEKIDINLYSRNFSIHESEQDYSSLMETVTDSMYDYMELSCYDWEKVCETTVPVKRITVIRLLPKDKE